MCVDINTDIDRHRQLGMKCYWTVSYILTDVKRRSIWIVYYSITLHVHRNISQQLFYYVKSIFQLKNLSFSRLDVAFRFAILHKADAITILRHRLCDTTWSDFTIRDIKIHATSSNVDLMWLASGPMKWLLFIPCIIKTFLNVEYMLLNTSMKRKIYNNKRSGAR